MLFSGRNYKMAVVGFLEIISTGYKKKKSSGNHHTDALKRKKHVTKSAVSVIKNKSPKPTNKNKSSR